MIMQSIRRSAFINHRSRQGESLIRSHDSKPTAARSRPVRSYESRLNDVKHCLTRSGQDAHKGDETETLNSFLALTQKTQWHNGSNWLEPMRSCLLWLGLWLFFFNPAILAPSSFKEFFTLPRVFLWSHSSRWAASLRSSESQTLCFQQTCLLSSVFFFLLFLCC